MKKLKNAIFFHNLKRKNNINYNKYSGDENDAIFCIFVASSYREK